MNPPTLKLNDTSAPSLRQSRPEAPREGMPRGRSLHETTDAFIVAASNVHLERPSSEHLGDAMNGNAVDWQRVLTIGRLHRVLPGMTYSLRRAGIVVPDAVRRELDNAFSAAHESAAAYHAELIRLLEYAHYRRVKCLLISGEMLAARYYPHVATRPFGDADLLVRRHDLRPLGELLRSHGYEQGFAERGVIRRPTKRERLFARIYMKHAIAFVKYSARNLFVIEPHHTLFWRRPDGGIAFDLPMDDVIDRSVPIRLGCAIAWTLHPTDLLLYLCIDIYEDARRIEKILRSEDLQLLRFLDVHAVISRGIDWNEFIERIHKWRMHGPAYFTLQGLSELYPVVPDRVLRAIAPESPLAVDVIGFPEELQRNEPPLSFDRNLRDRLFDHEYRTLKVHEHASLLRETTFQRLRRMGDSV